MKVYMGNSWENPATINVHIRKSQENHTTIDVDMVKS